MTIPETPQCDLLNNAQVERATIVELLNWLSSQGIHLATTKSYSNGREELLPMHVDPEGIALQFLGIDVRKLDAERRALLDTLRKEAR